MNLFLFLYFYCFVEALVGPHNILNEKFFDKGSFFNYFEKKL